jgi:uncharacterized lipoprotein YbaY
MARVSGEIRFPRLKRPLHQAVVKILVNDVTRADARAKTMARAEAGPCSAEAGEDYRIPFTIEVDDGEIDPGARYVLAAHADLDADGEVSQGDYVTIQSYPVLTRGYPVHADLELLEVE